VSRVESVTTTDSNDVRLSRLYSAFLAAQHWRSDVACQSASNTSLHECSPNDLPLQAHRLVHGFDSLISSSLGRSSAITGHTHHVA
jgi:hypothetical protein